MFGQVKIIGICGRKSSGKSVLSEELQLNAYFNAESIPFAKALKDGLAAMGVPMQALHNPKFKEAPQQVLCGHSGRYAMQTLGTEWGRDIMGSDFWVNMWRLKVNQSKAKVIIVDDIRFEQELTAVMTYPGAFVVGINRPTLEPLPPAWKFWDRVHRSERFSPERFGVPMLQNNGTRDDLYQKFLQIHPLG